MSGYVSLYTAPGETLAKPDVSLEPEAQAKVEQHLNGCPTYPPLYAPLVAATGALREPTIRDPDTGVLLALAERLNTL